MKSHLTEIKQALTKYNIRLSEENIQKFVDTIQLSQQYFPKSEQHALIIKLLTEWETRKNEKIIATTSEACRIQGGPRVTTFGILSVDWPGLFDSCSGVIHEMGWNIYFTKGISIAHPVENLGIVLIGILTDKEETHQKLLDQIHTILSKILQAAVGTRAKTYLLAEEIRKLEFYSQVIAYIEKVYHEKDLEQIIGLNGEAVKYFAARSRDYIENRKIEDIAQQIIRNFTFIQKVQKTGGSIQLDISNFATKTQGTFTGVSVAGPAHLLNLEDCLKTIELTVPNFELKHNREFTTENGISLFRIEFTDSSDHALSELDKKRLKKAFSTMVLNKRRNRAQWIESIGGFEQYARAIIPLLVREAQSTEKTQVYLSAGHITDLSIDFKVIVVVPESHDKKHNLVNMTVNHLEAVPGIHILRVKPPKKFGATRVFIIDLRVSLVDIENTETLYRTIKERVYAALGEFRDFDEGMRTMDATKLKSVRRRMKGISKTLVRELYYSIEDFFRIGASDHEIIAHIRIALAMLKTIDEKQDPILVLSRQIGADSKNGKHLPTASVICVSYPHEHYLLPKILEILEPYEVTLSRLEKMGRDILICRITQKESALPDRERNKLVKRIQKLTKEEKRSKRRLQRKKSISPPNYPEK